MWLFILFTHSWPYHFYHIAGVCWIKITFVTKKYRKCGCILSNNIKLIIMKKLYSAKHNSLPKQSDIFFALQLSTLLTVSHWQWYHFFTGISSLWQCKKNTVQEIQTEIQDSIKSDSIFQPCVLHGSRAGTCTFQPWHSIHGIIMR